jgi:hypothetical protein
VTFLGDGRFEYQLGKRLSWLKFLIFLSSCKYRDSRAIDQVVAGFPPWRPGFDPKSSHVRFVVKKVALGQVCSEYFGFPCQSSLHEMLHTHLLSWAGIIG